MNKTTIEFYISFLEDKLESLGLPNEQRFNPTLFYGTLYELAITRVNLNEVTQ